jgi:gliding motility-associated-like protein
LSATTGATVTASPTATTTYTVTGNSNGCTGSATVTVNISTSLNVTVTPNNPNVCPGGNVQLIASGATDYTWDPATGLSSTTGGTVTANPSATTTYNIHGSDATGCTGSTTVTVNVSVIGASASGTDENCGQSNATATAAPTGNCTQAYTYLWNTSPPQTTQTATNIPAGTYIVTVSCDACNTTASVTVNNIPGPTATITNTEDEICGQSNGSASVTASGGAPAYTYQWNSVPPQNTQTLTGVHAGTYVVTITDSNNCVTTSSATINNLPPPVIILQNAVPANCGYSNGSLTILVTGGTQPYQYLWNTTPLQTSDSVTGVPTGIYTVTVTDSNNCITVYSDSINELPGPASSATGTPENCYHGDGTVTVLANGGYGTYTYTWNTNPPQTTATVINLSAGTYIVTVNDGGCVSVSNVSIGNTPGPTADFSVHPHVLTMGDNVTFFDNSSGVIVTWEWTLGDGSTSDLEQFSHIYENVGVYPVTMIITDANGCKDTISDTIIVKDIFTIYIPSAFSPDDNGKNDFFFPEGINWDPAHYEMYIFNRWGELIYETKTIGDKWNGTVGNKGTIDDVIIDVYVYLIRVKELEGPKHEYVGRVTIVR